MTARRKAKTKAPLPPSETKNFEVSSFDGTEPNNYTMEQKENITDKDIELSVVLPGDVIKSTTVNGSKPMMDLLIFLCAQYHLNPSSYTIDLISAEKRQIKFKPNTPIGMLEVDKVILKPKHMDKKKPTPIMPEQTIRVVVNYKRTQKTVMRVSPHEPLQEFIPIICSKCEFDPLHTVLLKNYQSQEPLDVTKSLNDLGLRELYAMNVNKATSADDFNLSSLQDSYQMSQNPDTLKERENKGFFSFFQRSKKKREQTASAPATPLMSKPRPTFINRSNTISKQYDSNTLPSEMPKKRRAPLPPMPASQSVPQDLEHTQVRHASSCVVKSSSVDDNEQGQLRLGIVRTGSLQLSGTSSVNSSLRRTKRKAPSPPSRIPQDQRDNSKRTASESAESTPVESIVEERETEVLFPTGNKVDITRATVPSCASHCLDAANHEQNTLQQVTDETNHTGNTGCPDATEMPSKSGICSEYSLDEISEKEEKNIQHKEESESADTSLMTQGISASFISTDVPLDIGKSDSASSSSIPGNGSVDNFQSSKEEKQENMSTDGKGPHSKIDGEQITFENDKKLGILDPNKIYDHSGTRFLPATTGEKENQCKMGEINTADVREKNKLEVDKLSNCQEYKNDISTNQDDNPQVHLGIQIRKLNQTNIEIVKTQDVAIQTTPSDNSCGRTTLSEMIVLQDCESSTFKGVAHMQNLDIDNPPLQLMNKMQESVEVSTEFNHQRQEAVDDKAIPIKNQSNIYDNDSGLTPSERAPKSAISSPIKGYPVYRQDFKPKPKPSNEITREYIPKIGMTTYKIVPPKSLEILKDCESDAMSVIKDQDGVTLEMSPQSENSKEFGVQTEILCGSKNTSQSESGLKYEPALAVNDQLHKTNRITNSVSTSELRVTTESKQIETEASKPNIGNGITPLMLSSGNTNSSPETQEKSSVLSPTMKPSSFYLQMQRRASGHYVTSAIARSVSAATSPTQREATNTERDKKLTSSDQSFFPLHKTHNFPAQLNEEEVDNEKKIDASTFVKTAKPLSFPSCQPATLNLRTLRTFAVPKPYSSSRPSPFALAVSSAIKRSQSFSKPHAISSQPSKEKSPVELSSATSTGDVNQFLQTLTGGSQHNMMDKKSNCTNSEQNSQVQSSADHPTSVFERETALTFQSSDPEQIHQSLLAAIRSGEAAAKLKRVAAPSNTISVNGRSRLSHSFPTEEKYNH
ncbi:cordon-bleu protein-like 1 isoform X1 [Mauremys mutica]|uniref:cordon-bleu protein-like 1 isoform X1 n=1 Tax=Mauremys mutica TaxID=74926 RepID=UPI001D13DF37|nr:cordon-bleu protein-like 1 isoform X1 [Mauremys mutica]